MSGHFQYLPIQNWHKAAEHKPKHLPIFLLDAYQSVIGKGIRCLFSNRENMPHEIKVYIKPVFSKSTT